MTTPTVTPTIETTDPFDALAVLVLALLDYYAGGFRIMPEPLLQTLPHIWIALRSDDQTKRTAAYWRLQETLRQCGIEIGE